jgi:hypothetical protein
MGDPASSADESWWEVYYLAAIDVVSIVSRDFNVELRLRPCRIVLKQLSVLIRLLRPKTVRAVRVRMPVYTGLSRAWRIAPLPESGFVSHFGAHAPIGGSTGRGGTVGSTQREAYDE